MGHPAHVHQFKHMIWKLKEHGHEIKICATDKDIELDLLNSYKFDHQILGKNDSKSLKNKVNLSIKSAQRMMSICRVFKPDLFVSRVSPFSGYVSRLLRKPHIAFADDDIRILSYPLAVPLTDYIFTPEYFKNIDFGKKHIRYKGYKELAYLHPNHFKPNEYALECLGLNKNDKYILIRFVAWEAVHDHGFHGIKNKLNIVKELENEAHVFITSESQLCEPLEKYRLIAPPEKIHDLLYYANLLIGDSQTMTTESAVLGTPAIRCNSFVGNSDMSNFIELEKKYNLIFNFANHSQALQKAKHILETPGIKELWKKRRDEMLRDKIDVTSFMVWLIEEYPRSCYMMKQDSSVQLQFQ